MRFSVVIPIYNNKDWLPHCFDSILEQTFTDYEVILVDDMSYDGNTEVIEKYLPKFKKKCKGVKFIRNKTRRLNGGSRNVGIAEATGEYIMCIDCDDYFYDNQVFADIDKKLNGEDIMFLDYKVHTKDYDMDCFQHYNSLDEALRGYSCALWTRVVKRTLLLNNLQKEGTLFEDLGQHYRLVLNAKTFTCLGRISHVWNRLNSNSISNMLQYAYYRFNFCGEMYEIIMNMPESETRTYLKEVLNTYLGFCNDMVKKL